MRRRLTLWQWLNVGPFRVARGGRPASSKEITEAITKAIGRCPWCRGRMDPAPPSAAPYCCDMCKQQKETQHCGHDHPSADAYTPCYEARIYGLPFPQPGDHPRV